MGNSSNYLGFPLWFPLLMFILTMLLVFYIIWWSAVIVLWSIEGSLIMSVFAAIVNMFAFTFRGELLSGFGYFGLSLLTAGLSIFLFMGCVAVTKATFQLMKKVTLKIKKSIIGEEN